MYAVDPNAQLPAAWLIWAGVALVAGILEVTTVHLVFIMFGGGAVAAAGAALVGVPPVGQILTFTVVSAALLGLVRPGVLRRWRHRTPHTVTGTAALVGREAMVVAAVGPSAGQVKLAGEVWTARWSGPGVLPVGTVVTVLAIEGATAVVEPAPGALPSYGAIGSARPDDLADPQPTRPEPPEATPPTP